jgi:hypothetical protein
MGLRRNRPESEFVAAGQDNRKSDPDAIAAFAAELRRSARASSGTGRRPGASGRRTANCGGR